MKTINQIRSDFPFFSHHPEVIYADSAATSLKPQTVLEACTKFWTDWTSNIHRSTHHIAERATIEFEAARKKIAQFIHADTNEVVFTPNATHAFNLLSSMLRLSRSDLVIGSILEHHSNMLPWQNVSDYHALPTDKNGDIDLSGIPDKIVQRASVMSINYVSNVTGKVQDIAAILAWAKSHDLITVVDASQAVAHLPINVKDLDVDFLIFSGHKMLGPSGVGVLYGKYALLDQFDPCLHGGGMVQKVMPSHHVLKPIPHRFEAGTPNIEGVIGLGAAVTYLESIGMQWVQRHGQLLSDHFMKRWHEINGFRLISEGFQHQIPIFSVAPHDGHVDVHALARTLSDRFQILVTAGKQCAHPYYDHRNIDNGSIRFSLGIYNQTSEIDQIIQALKSLSLFLPKAGRAALTA